MSEALSDYTGFDALGLAELVANGELTSGELVDTALARIDRLNPKLNAVIHRLDERARQASASELAGPFAGVPFLLKDTLGELADVPNSYGSRFYADWCPSRNAAVIDRYEAAGLVILGKANMSEFGLVPTTNPEHFGPARNPWDSARSPGGSSGGSAVAVAAGLVPMAHAADGGGSIRIPSACCGLVGLKPTRGRVPVGPLYAEAWAGFATAHVITRSVRDCAAALDVSSGPLPGDWHWLDKSPAPFLEAVGQPPGRLRIGFTAEPFLPGEVHADCSAALQTTAQLLDELGHDVIEARPPLDAQRFARAFLTILSGQLGASLEGAKRTRGRKWKRHEFEERTQLAAHMGKVFSATEYAVALQELQALTQPFHTFFEDYDVLLCPTVAHPPGQIGFLDPHGLPKLAQKLVGRVPLGKLLKAGPTLDDAARDSFSFIPFTPVFNVTGQPSMSLPLHWNDDGLPIGLMFSAAYTREDTLFRLAAQLEEAKPWAGRLRQLADSI